MNSDKSGQGRVIPSCNNIPLWPLPVAALYFKAVNIYFFLGKACLFLEKLQFLMIIGKISTLKSQLEAAQCEGICSQSMQPTAPEQNLRRKHGNKEN